MAPYHGIGNPGDYNANVNGIVLGINKIKQKQQWRRLVKINSEGKDDEKTGIN